MEAFIISRYRRQGRNMAMLVIHTKDAAGVKHSRTAHLQHVFGEPNVFRTRSGMELECGPRSHPQLPAPAPAAVAS